MDISGVINSGNYFRENLTLVDDLVVNGGNFILADFTLGAFTLVINGGNLLGFKKDGVQVDPASPPAAITVNGGTFATPPYTWQEFRPLAKATEIIAQSTIDIRTLYLDALEEAFRIILTGGPALLKVTFLTDLDTWMAANDSPFESTRFGAWLLDQINPAWTWAQARDYIQQFDAPTWKGVKTQLVQEYS
jgi:hypothetical protein